MRRRDADPELRRLIETTAAGRNVSVVCSLRPDPRRSASPEETTHQVEALIQRVGDQTGVQPTESTVFGNLGSFALSAPAAFVDHLIAQPEIATATANPHREDLLIRPVERRRIRRGATDFEGTDRSTN